MGPDIDIKFDHVDEVLHQYGEFLVFFFFGHYLQMAEDGGVLNSQCTPFVSNINITTMLDINKLRQNGQKIGIPTRKIGKNRNFVKNRKKQEYLTPCHNLITKPAFYMRMNLCFTAACH